MPFEAIYSDYKDAGGVQFPMHIVQKQGGYPVFDLTISDVKVNGEAKIAPPGQLPPPRPRRPRQRSQRSSATAST